MNWLYIIAAIILPGIVIYFMMRASGEDPEEATSAGVTISMGCFVIVLQLLASVAAVWILWSIGKWLFV